MEPRVITQFQNVAQMGYFHPLTCGNDSHHPPLVADTDTPQLGIRCVFCSYKKEIGVAEYKRYEQMIDLARELYVRQEELRQKKQHLEEERVQAELLSQQEPTPKKRKRKPKQEGS